MKGNTNANCYPQHRWHDLWRCVKSVTRLLEGVEGVEKAEVSLENKNAVITFDESKDRYDALIDAVEDGGYDVAL